EKPEDVIGKDDHAMAWREHAGKYRDDDQTVIRSGEARLLFEETHASRTGEREHLLVSKLPLRDARGAIVGLLGTYEDITDLKRAEEAREHLQAQLNQAQKMESVGRLAGGVAHDFNNKLQVILGSVELLLEKLPPDDTSRPVLLEVQTAARRSADLTRQLLAFSRKQAISPVVLDLGEAVASSLKMLGRLIGENIRLNFAASTDLWPVLMDRGQLDQILANLAINARDAIPGSGTISIEIVNRTLRDDDCRDRPDFVAPGDFVTLTFRDDGEGMPADILAHIFEPFFTTKDVGKGTGLGLATVYGIVKQSGGAISAESEPGRGTAFTLHLPRSQAGVRASGEEPAARIPAGTETILLAEDETGVLDLVRRTLTQQGYKVLAASSPRLALKMCEAHAEPIHLLLTDVIMPVMNGTALAERVRELRPGIRVLFMSGYTAETMQHAVRLPEDLHVLQKPFSRADLAQRVRDVLDSPPPPCPRPPAG
ncbi:MAG: response regulator, partial [Verrucomicrobia bacterium]|nr:response regulator [Verrucomicrobiota bacterium]